VSSLRRKGKGITRLFLEDFKKEEKHSRIYVLLATENRRHRAGAVGRGLTPTTERRLTG